MAQFFDCMASEPEFRSYFIKFVGGAAAVTKVFGQGVTVTYSATGIVNLTWTENPGNFLGATFGFQATTASAVKGYTCVPGVYNASTKTLTLNITGATEVLTDLAALQWLNCWVMFKASSV